MRTVYIIIIGLFLFNIANAQDGHYTQFSQNPLFLNPALVGGENGQIRLGGIYRSQWQSVKAPYTNYGVFADAKLKKFSLGLLINQNKAGDTGYKKSNVLFALGYRKPIGEGNNTLSIGAQVGLNQIGIDPTKLTFDNQYNPGVGFDETLMSGENLTNGTTKMTDVNVGLTYNFELKSTVPSQGEIGLAFYHVNEPEAVSMTGEVMNLSRKVVAHGALNFDVNERLGVEPMLLYAAQGHATEIVAGLNLGFSLSDSSGFKLGIGTRLKDAILFTAQINRKKVSFGFGFDYNISKLRQAGNFNNAMEVSMIYRIPFKAPSREPLDTDKDGILDRDDDCPKVPGIEKLNGCPEEMQKKEEVVKGPDFDKDGILDDNDLCPYEFGYVQFQGCNDQDADGIWDNVDVCPSLPGKVENHGCPIEIPGIDSDRDGVPDRFDKCIYIRGLAEFNGCPDTDRDGVSDLLDHCPYVKGKKAWDGCPGDPNGDITKSRGRREISVNNVEFATNKAEIRGDYRNMLDRVAEKLLDQTQFRLMLEGHTDNEGNPSYNIQLSQKRVYAVRDYLISKGVNRNYIEIYHFGENKPKGANDTEYGRARNRRVELILLDVE